MTGPVEALLVVDVQRALVEGDTAVPDATDLLDRLRSLLERARGSGVPVLHLQDNGVDDDLIRRGTEGWELALAPADGEPVIGKDADDGFEGTVLDQLLRAHGVETLAVVGIQSEMCVAATVRGAIARGFAVVLPRDGHATFDIPAAGPSAPGVAARLVSRVAEWSLGDGVDAPDSVEAVLFAERHA